VPSCGREEVLWTRRAEAFDDILSLTYGAMSTISTPMVEVQDATRQETQGRSGRSVFSRGTFT
jgi:hypothetical protein